MVVRFQVLTATSMGMAVFCDVVPCSLVEIDRRFTGTYCLHLQGPWVREELRFQNRLSPCATVPCKLRACAAAHLIICAHAPLAVLRAHGELRRLFSVLNHFENGHHVVCPWHAEL
jgi:hypothetical protein